MTAEFAVALTGVMLVLALCLGAMGIAAQQIALESLASSGARMLARGDDLATVRTAVAAGAPGATLSQSASGEFVCVALERGARLGSLGVGDLVLSARGCALAADPLPAEAGGAP